MRTDEVEQRRRWAEQWSAVYDAVEVVLERAGKLRAELANIDDCVRQGMAPAAVAALPTVDAAVTAVLSALGAAMAALPSSCEWCGERGGVAAGSHGRCTICLRMCDGCEAVEMTEMGVYLCPGCVPVAAGQCATEVAS